MARYLKPDAIIENIEKMVIEPFADLAPILVIITKGDKAPAGEKSYFKQLQKNADKYGVEVHSITPTNVADVICQVGAWKTNPRCAGILNISSFGYDIDREIANIIPPRLDVDCSSDQSYGMLVMSNSAMAYRLAPCTAAACYKILEYEKVPLEGKSVGIVGRSIRVGKPLAEILTKKDATVTLYHSKSGIPDLTIHDIVVVATGAYNELDPCQFRPGQIVIDVGINCVDGKIVGDLDTEKIAGALGSSGMITPAPGCVGPITNVLLFAKLFTNRAIMTGRLNERL